MLSPRSSLWFSPLVLVLLAACSRGSEQDPNANRDPIVAEAVNDPLMADPDLASQNRGGAALTGGGPASAPIPAFKNTPEEIEASKDAAETALGGPIPAAPGPQRTAEKSQLDGAATPLAVATALKLADGECGKGFAFSASWAARLPGAVPVYPRGHTLVAGGNDNPQCKLRSVRFVTPVAPSDVVDFYFASAAKARLMPKRAREGADEVVTGGLEDQEFLVYVRKRSDGLTEVDLVTAGL